jgi:hypothetical protein
MGVHAAQISHDQGIRGDFRVSPWHSELFQGGDQEAAQLSMIDPCHCLSRWFH